MNELFLAQIQLSHKELLKRRLFSPYAMHQLLWECFPGRPEAARNFLFRCDESGLDRKILLLSQTIPQMTSWGQWNGIKSFSPLFSEGDLFWFKLRANPVRRDAANGKLKALTTADALHGWMQQKGKQHGFALKSEIESFCRMSKFNRSSDGSSILLNIADFSGVLIVTDQQRFTEAFIQGIGRGKAFGCGMLLLRNILQ